MVADGGREKLDLDPVIAHFENWMEKYRVGRFIKLSKEDKWLFIRYVNRFMEYYNACFGKS